MASKSRSHEDGDSGERYFLNPESVSIHLYCSICQDVFVDPQRAPCGHSFCQRCISSWLRQSRTCPEDRRPLKLSELHHDFILENIISDQMVACEFRRRGCEFIGQLGNLKTHRKACCYNPKNLPEFLKKDPIENQTDEGTYEDHSEGLATPVKPSLKMRLFSAGGGQRDLLFDMFNKENTTEK